jgi:hypothetical protein
MDALIFCRIHGHAHEVHSATRDQDSTTVLECGTDEAPDRERFPVLPPAL